MNPVPFEREYPEAAKILQAMFACFNKSRLRVRGDVTVLPERNARCECGSGRKWKKCCALLPRGGMTSTMRITKINGEPCNLVVVSPPRPPRRRHGALGLIAMSSALAFRAAFQPPFNEE